MWGSRSKSNHLDALIDQIKSTLLTNPGRIVTGENYDTLPKAAVSMILRPDFEKDELSALLVKRRVQDGDPWSGHMAFPGGQYDMKDEHLITTVIREVLEETSVDLKNCSIIGTLDDVVPSNFSIKVTPYVALAQQNLEVKVNNEEIADYFWIPLSYFLDGKNFSTYSFERMGIQVSVPSYQFMGQHVIWGMTLKIIQDFISKVYHDLKKP